MPGRPSDPGDSLVLPSSQVHDPVVYTLRHGIKPPLFRVYVSWSRGNLLHIACLRDRATSEKEQDGNSGHQEERTGGVLLEIQIQGGANGLISEAQKRKIAYGSVPAFALLQSRKNSLMTASRLRFASFRNERYTFLSGIVLVFCIRTEFFASSLIFALPKPEAFSRNQGVAPGPN